jgi:MFS family permease
MADNTSASSKMEPLEVEFPNTDNTNSSSDRVVLLGGNSSLNLMDDQEQFGLNTTPGKCISTCRPCCKYMPCYPGVNEVNIFAPGNIAIPVFYCMLGFLLKFPYVALRYYLIETIKATPSQQAIVYSVVMGMPWNFKMIYGFISDTCPIRGRRRKPYMFGGTICCSISWLMFGSGILGSPGMGLMCVLLFTAIFGMIFADVMADALVVERMKGEQSDKKGGIQSTCWMLRFSGSFFGFVMGAVFMDGFGFHPQAIFFLQGLVPLVTMLPPLYLLNDPVVDGYQGKWVRSTELGNAIGGHAVARRR